MNIKIVILSLLLTCSLFGTETDSQKVVTQIQEHYQKLTTFSATFKQTFFHKAYKKRKKSQGTVLFKQKLKMKWHYKQPEEKMIISDGKTLWIYEPENEQVFKASVKKSELKETIALLFGSTDLAEKYTINLLKRDQVTKELPIGITLELTPKQKEPRYQKVTLFLDHQYNLQATETIDQLGNINTIRYQTLQLNKELKNELFQFTVPKNVEIIEQDK